MFCLAWENLVSWFTRLFGVFRWGGSPWAARVVPCGDLAHPISWLVLKIDPWLNHLKEPHRPLWKHLRTGKPVKSSVASSFGTGNWELARPCSAVMQAPRPFPAGPSHFLETPPVLLCGSTAGPCPRGPSQCREQPCGWDQRWEWPTARAGGASRLAAATWLGLPGRNRCGCSGYLSMACNEVCLLGCF